MVKVLLSIAAAFIVIVVGNTTIVISQPNMKPNGSTEAVSMPVAKKVPHVLKIHGYEVTDNYFWLRGDRTNLDPEIRKYLEDNNAYTTSVMGKYQPFVDSLYKEMLGRIKQTDSSVPYEKGGWWYFNTIKEGEQYPRYFRSKSRDLSNPQLILDQVEMAKGFKFYAIADMSVSDDGNLLAYAVDSNGYRQYELHIKNLTTGETMVDKVPRVTSLEWSADGKYLFLVQENPVSKRSDKFIRHTVGSADEGTMLFEEKDELFNLGVGRSRDGKMLFLGSGAKTMDEWRYLAADKPTGEWKMIAPRREGFQYSADYDNGAFYLVTNKDGAENFKVMSAPANDPSEKMWTDFIPYNKDVHIESIDFFHEYAVVSEKENGLEYLRVMDRHWPPGGPRKRERPPVRIETPEDVYTMGLGNNPEYNTKVIRYRYSSMITPNSTYEYDMDARHSSLIKQDEIPSGHDKTKYETSRVWATARDGVKVPVILLMKKGTKLDGSAPMLLYAYGSYGISTPPNFNPNRFSLVDRGMIYAIAQIRGGGELGEKWRLAGRMFTKMNTFNDFVDSAKWLIDKKYTSPDRLVIQGGSAGGLLMGAVVNQAPQLFKASIAQVPFVDVMNTMIDADLPLTTEEWIEWGNPRDDKKAWEYMVQYSPYDNVKAQKYPNMLIEVSLNDSQVPYWEGSKFAAKLREYNTGSSVILLKANMGAGHGGSSGRYDRLKETAFDYAYALTQVGIDK
ncbi:MAG: S9 family peptidase [Acidobacteria bacterium]|nr:S9 family peptidase [Acidobacteriota bacterium]